MFNYTAAVTEGILTVSCGGNSDDIYRYDVTAGQSQTIASICPCSAVVTDDNGNTIVAYSE